MEYSFIYITFISWIYLLSIIMNSMVAEIIGPQEYCTHDVFNATCPPNHVVMMESALYGRMRFGRCMQEDHGHVGCSANILSVLDRQCSGSRRCSVPVPIADLQVHGCPQEVQHYLEASYRCQTVEPTIECTRHQLPTLTATNVSKFLVPQSSNTKGRTLSGTKHCPWVITTEPGRVINLTILNFNTDKFADSPECDKVALIRDNNRTKEHNICNDNRREYIFYISMSHKIEIFIKSRIMTIDTPKFLLSYKAIGCANIHKMENAQIMREEDTLIVKCNHTGETFFLSCTGSQWLGQLHNCSKEIPGKIIQPNGRSSNFRYGWLLLIGIGVALGVALGIILLAGILAFIRRRKQDEKILNVSRHTSDPLLSEVTRESDDMSNYYERRIQALATIGPRSPRIPRDSIYKDRCSLSGVSNQGGASVSGANFHTLPSNYNQPYAPHLHQQQLPSHYHHHQPHIHAPIESPYCTCVQQHNPQQHNPQHQSQIITTTTDGQNNAQTSFITFKPGDPRNPSMTNNIESFVTLRRGASGGGKGIVSSTSERNNNTTSSLSSSPPPCGTGVRHITAARSLDLLKDSDHSKIAVKDTIVVNNSSGEDQRCTCSTVLGPTPAQNSSYQSSNGYFDNSNNKSI